MIGLLIKSKSFNGSDRRRKVQFLEKGPEKQKFLRETAAGTKGKNCAIRSLKKSLSLNDGSTGRSYSLNAEPKTITPKHSVVSDTRRLRPMKECGSAETELKPVLKKPRILSPSGLSSVSSGERKFGTHGEPISTNFSGTKCSDIKTSQKLIEPGNSRNLTHIAHRTSYACNHSKSLQSPFPTKQDCRYIVVYVILEDGDFFLFSFFFFVFLV